MSGACLGTRLRPTEWPGPTSRWHHTRVINLTGEVTLGQGGEASESRFVRSRHPPKASEAGAGCKAARAARLWFRPERPCDDIDCEGRRPRHGPPDPVPPVGLTRRRREFARVAWA